VLRAVSHYEVDFEGSRGSQTKKILNSPFKPPPRHDVPYSTVTNARFEITQLIDTHASNARGAKLNHLTQCEPMRGPSGPVSCTYVCTHMCARIYACVDVRACVCVRCVRVCVYDCVHTCVHALCTCACVCVCVRAHTCACVVYVRALCTCACICVRAYVVCACACEGIEDAPPLGVLPFQKRASHSSCLSTLGALRSGLGGFPGLSRSCLNLIINPNVSFTRPFSLKYFMCSRRTAMG